MPRTTATLDLRDVATRLDDELDELADEVADNDDPDDARFQQAQRKEAHLAGVQWAINEWAPDAEHGPEVTLGALTAGEYARVRDHVDATRKTLVGTDAGQTDAEGARQLAFVAAGLRDAPPLNEGMDVDARRRAVADEMAPQFVTWLESEIDDLSTPDVSAGNFAARLRDRVGEETTSH